MNIGFTKMHGLGNDFVVIDNMNGRISLSKEQIIFLCDRHKGIGGDGVILVESSEKADAFMNYYNSDGSAVEMCGTGTRCTAKFLKENILKENTSFKIDTRTGVKDIEYLEDGTFSVNMGEPFFKHEDFPEKLIELEGLPLHFVSMGNPHAVALVENINDHDLAALGPRIENNSNFPNKINFEIVEKKSSNEFIVKIWERGCGITLSSGTGSCAVYAIARKHHGADKEITALFPGGKLFLSENKEGEIIMRGPAESVYSGLIYVPE